MRTTAFALLLASSGCNWVFGLTPTVAVDGGDAADAPPAVETKLVWAATSTNSAGEPAPLQFAAVGSETTQPAVPTIMVGAPLGEMPALMPASYDITDGSFEIPYNLRVSPHRIVYTLPGETVAHEVQWSISGATLVVPRTSRLNAAVVPTNSGYTITPTGLAAAPSAPVVYTTGVFTADLNSADFTTSGMSTSFAYSTLARPLAGPPGAPESSKGDVVVLTEWSPHASTPSSQNSIDGFAIAKIDLAANTLSTPGTEPAWTNTNVDRTMKTTLCGSDCLPNFLLLSAQTRLDALGALRTTPYAQHLMYGVMPSGDLPGFVLGSAPDFVDRPMMLPFLSSTTIDSLLYLRDPTRVSPFDKYDRVLVAQLTSPRTVAGATLTTSVSVMTKQFITADLGFEAPIAVRVTLGGTNGTDLSATDGVMVPASSQGVTLAWNAEDGYTAHDWIVTLYEITNSRLARIREYQVLASTALIDGSLLQPGHTYTFAITSRKGLPSAQQGDFRPVAFPFSQTTTFAAAFTVQ